MTVYVNTPSEFMLDGLTVLKNKMCEDYNNFMPENKDMCEEYADSLGFIYGNKYVKMVSKGAGVKLFIVAVDDDKKFRKGDILKPAGWAAPARNAARGNILEGGYPINWTGPLYLK